MPHAVSLTCAPISARTFGTQRSGAQHRSSPFAFSTQLQKNRFAAARAAPRKQSVSFDCRSRQTKQFYSRKCINIKVQVCQYRPCCPSGPSMCVAAHWRSWGEICCCLSFARAQLMSVESERHSWTLLSFNHLSQDGRSVSRGESPSATLKNA